MRTLLVAVLLLGSGAFFIPVSEPQALSIDGVTLVAEQHADLDLGIAAGKYGKTGKNGKGSYSTHHSYASHQSVKGFVGSRATGMGCPDLVAVDLR